MIPAKRGLAHHSLAAATCFSTGFISSAPGDLVDQVHQFTVPAREDGQPPEPAEPERGIEMSLFRDGAAGAEQIVGRREDDPPQAVRIRRVGAGSTNCRTICGGRRRAMAAERRVHPALRKEDVAGSLNFLSSSRLGRMYLTDCVARSG